MRAEEQARKDAEEKAKEEEEQKKKQREGAPKGIHPPSYYAPKPKQQPLTDVNPMSQPTRLEAEAMEDAFEELAEGGVI